jgi:hypothetical protein
MSVVWFRSIPLRTFLDMVIAVDGLQRELQLMSLDADLSVPGEVAGGVAAREVFDDARAALFDQAIEAHEAGVEVTDLAATYADAAWPPILEVVTAVLRADDAASAGDLLTPPFPPDQRHLYEWMADEIHRQLSGEPPRPYEPAPT